jgi:protein-arginine kinase activator protein McsA
MTPPSLLRSHVQTLTNNEKLVFYVCINCMIKIEKNYPFFKINEHTPNLTKYKETILMGMTNFVY